jgi:two-component system, OmpR family, sensor kinase
MRWFRHRLVVRLYIFQAVLFAFVAATIFLVGRVILQPALHAAREQPMAWGVDDMLAQHDAPEQIQRRLEVLRQRVGAKVTVYTPDGRVMASTASPPPAPVDEAAGARLSREGQMTLSRHRIAVGHVDEGRLTAYAILDWEPEQPMWKAAIVLASALILLGIGSIVLARSLARPLERLASVTKAFGLGDLRARASTCREDEIGNVGRAFNEMADRVEKLRRAEKELLANVSHELRTPLARIRVGVELADGGDPRMIQRYLSGIAEDLTEVEQLLGDIITAARLDLSSEQARDPYPPLRLTATPLGGLVEALVRRFRDSHTERTVHLAIERDPKVPVDRVMLKHALSNVLDNAHKYSPMECAIELSVRVEAGEGGDRAIVDVRDHGTGMDPDDVPHVFTAFFRGDRSRRRETGGVGLGLTLAKRIVEAHGGTIDLESRRGEGTVVRIALPARSALEQLPA